MMAGDNEKKVVKGLSGCVASPRAIPKSILSLFEKCDLDHYSDDDVGHSRPGPFFCHKTRAPVCDTPDRGLCFP